MQIEVLVTIPRGGLGTFGGGEDQEHFQGSPSHTVGLELSRGQGLVLYCGVAIPPSGLGTIGYFVYEAYKAGSPSHTVGLEHGVMWVLFYMWSIWISLHPTQWALNPCASTKKSLLTRVFIPPSGLRTKKKWVDYYITIEVSIPPSGLGTVYHIHYEGVKLLTSLHPTQWA